jgi:hypothetical protein
MTISRPITIEIVSTSKSGPIVGGSADTTLVDMRDAVMMNGESVPTYLSG